MAERKRRSSNAFDDVSFGSRYAASFAPMVHSLPMLVPYQTGQCCIVFKDDAESGAMIGCRGTIARLLTHSVRRNPATPDLWVYRVTVPSLNVRVNVAGKNLFVTGEMEPSAEARESSQPNICEIRFDSAPRDDNDEIHGALRLPGRDWELFSFTRSRQSCPSFQVRMKMHGVDAGGRDIIYDVPADERLDLAFVLHSLARVLGGNSIE